MKKLISLIATISMVATMFVNVAHAAGEEVTFTTTVNEFANAGVVYAQVITKIEAPKGFAGFKMIHKYDAEAFTLFSGPTASAHLGSVEKGNPADGVLTAVFGSSTNKMPTVPGAMPWDPEEAQTYTVTYMFKLNEGFYNGDYAFDFLVDDEWAFANNLIDASKKLLSYNVDNASKVLTITQAGDDPNAGTDEPEGPTVVEGSVGDTTVKTSTIPGKGQYAGVTATFDAGTYSAITFNFDNGLTTAPYVWDLTGANIAPIEGAGMVFGLNIQNIPAEIKTFKCTGVTATVAE